MYKPTTHQQVSFTKARVAVVAYLDQRRAGIEPQPGAGHAAASRASSRLTLPLDLKMTDIQVSSGGAKAHTVRMGSDGLGSVVRRLRTADCKTTERNTSVRAFAPP